MSMVLKTRCAFYCPPRMAFFVAGIVVTLHWRLWLTGTVFSHRRRGMDGGLHNSPIGIRTNAEQIVSRKVKEEEERCGH